MIGFHENMNVCRVNVDTWIELPFPPLSATLKINKITVFEKLQSHTVEINLQFQKRATGKRKKVNGFSNFP